MAVLVAAWFVGCDGQLRPDDRSRDESALTVPKEQISRPGVCHKQPGYFSRPRWNEVATPPGKPDYVNVADNFKIENSLRLIASIIDKAVTKLKTVSSFIEKAESPGECLCSGDTEGLCVDGQSCEERLTPDSKTRAECEAACAAIADPNGDGNTDDALCQATGSVEGWRQNDLYFNPAGEVRKALKTIDWLDQVLSYITSDSFASALQVAGNIANTIENWADIVAKVSAYVNDFSEGFHLGAYSEQRPALWHCVSRGGSGAYARMLGLGGGNYSIGARYWSGLAAKQVKGLFTTGGFALEAHGKAYTFLPGASYNITIDGFRPWDKNKLFGIPGVGIAGGGVQLSQVDNLDIFNLVDQSQLNALDGNADGQLNWNEFFYTGFYPVDYVSAFDGQAYSWPRLGDDTPGENTSTAIFGAGLNLPIHLKPRSITIPAIPIAPGVTLQPYFKLAAGIDWYHKKDKLLTRIRDMLNENLPPAQQLNDTHFARNMHFFQAPDVSRDVGVNGYVRPELGAELAIGIKLRKFLRLGIFAHLSISASLEPGAYGDTIDINRSLAEDLSEINPPVDQPCSPITEQTTTQRCSNLAFSASTGSYNCGAGGNPKCEDYGYCQRSNGALTHDVTEEDCKDRDEFHPYICAPYTTSTVTGWQGPGCNPISTGFPETIASTIVSGIQNVVAPLHSIFSYALADLKFIAFLNAGAKIQLELKIFGKRIKWTLWQWSDSWDIGSTYKSWFQIGLEARYQDQCSALGDVINHQPDYVTRYPSPTTPDWANYDTQRELVDNWCYPTTATDRSYDQFNVPTNESLAGSVNNTVQLGEDVGNALWSANQLCVGELTIWQWLATEAGVGQATCSYQLSAQNTIDFPCKDMQQVLMQALGCINFSAAPSNAPSLTVDGVKYVNLAALLVEPEAELLYENFKPQYTSGAWFAWYSAAQSCFEGQFNVDKLSLNGTQVTKCCGDGIVQPPEQCDEGSSNGTPAASCSTSCQRKQGATVCGNGVLEGLEECDDGNVQGGDGCSATCMLENPPLGPPQGNNGKN